MSLRSLVLVVVFLVVACFGSAQSVPLPERLFPELEGIIRDALKQSPRMLERQLDVDIAEGSRIQARAGLLPSASGSISYYKARESREGVVGGSFDTDKLYYSFTITQPLYHWGERRNSARIGQIRKHIAERQYAEAYSALAQEIRNTYLQLITQRAQLAAAERAQQQAEETLAEAEERHRRGAISGAAVFDPSIAAQRAELATDRTRASLEDSERTFQLLTGRAAPAAERLPDTIPQIGTIEGEIDRLLGGFLSQDEPQTLSALTLQDQLEVERLNLANTRTRLRPKFNLVAGLSQDEQTFFTETTTRYSLESYYAGVSASWQVFDGFAKRGAMMSALAAFRRAEERFRRYSESVGIDAQKAARSVHFAERQMQIQDRLFESSRNFLDFRQNEARSGAASASDVQVAQARYDSARVSALQARSEFLMQLSAFIALIMDDPALAHLPR